MTGWSYSSIQVYLGEPLSLLGCLRLLTWAWKPEWHCITKSPFQKGRWIPHCAAPVGLQRTPPESHSVPGRGASGTFNFLSFLSLRILWLFFFPPGGRISDRVRCKCIAHFSQRKTCLPMWKHMPFPKSMKPQSEADVSGQYHRFQQNFEPIEVWLNDLLTRVRVSPSKVFKQFA